LTLLAVLLSLGLLAAGCGDDSDDSDAAAAEAEETALTPEEAIAEIALVRQGIDDGLAAYEDGDQAAAEEFVTDAYLEHFELVEPPLEEVDPELNEALEVLIRETLGGAVADGEPVAEVRKLVDEAHSGLDEAEQALRGGSTGDSASAGSGSGGY
jgi:high-affinity iron transporter